jgi:hypothetical protein
MMILLPLVSLAVHPTPPAIESSSPRGAQARLAELVGDADAVHSISVRRATTNAKPDAIEVSLDREGMALRIVASINTRGEVTAITVDERGASIGELGSLSWLSSEIAAANAITRIVVDEDDAVMLTTDAGDALMIIPGRGSGGAGNDAASARWAAAWDSPEA